MALIGRFVVGIARRKNHAFDAERHDLVKEAADAVRVGSIEKRGVRGDAEPALDRLADSFDRKVVTAFAAYGKIMVFALAIKVHREGEVFRRLEFGQALR